jgi:hypothetical protein
MFLSRVSVSNLRIVLRSSVINRESRMAFSEAVRSHSATLEKPYSHREYTGVNDAFDVLLGSPTRYGLMRMLTDHKTQLEDQVLERIAVWGCIEDRHVEECRMARTILILLSDRRESPTSLVQDQELFSSTSLLILNPEKRRSRFF